MRLLTINDVIERVSFKKTKLYNWIKEGKFPKPISIADTRSVRWVESDVETWIMNQISLNKGTEI